VGNNRSIITPLVLLLVSSTVMSLWSIVLAVNYLILPSLHWIVLSVSWPYLASVLLPSVLDFILTGIMLSHLIQKKKQIHSAHTPNILLRKRRVAICTAADHLCHLCIRVLYPVLNCGYKQTTGLADGYPARDPARDREALRSFALFLDKRSTSTTTRRATYGINIDAHCAKGSWYYTHAGRPSASGRR
jgi:hypothetical protein